MPKDDIQPDRLRKYEDAQWQRYRENNIIRAEFHNVKVGAGVRVGTFYIRKVRKQ
jgi:hypothetical protein